MADLALTTTTTTSTAGTRRSYPTYGLPWWRRLIATREFAILVGVVLVAVVAAAAIPGFATPLTLSFLLLDVAAIMLIALPLSMVLISGEIDLSVASTVGLSNVVLGVLYASGWPVAVAALGAIAVGVVIGAVNGFLVTVVKLPSLAVTLGTLALFRGIAVGLLGTESVTDFPVDLKALANANIPATGVPLIMIAVAVFALAFGWLLHLTPFGRGVFVMGRNREVAEFSGVRVGRSKFLLFLLTGVMASLAGIYYTFRYGSARGDNAEGLELAVLAAVLLGGVSIFGGRGSIFGVLVGVLLIGIVQSAMRFANLSADVINIVVGGLLVASVITPALVSRLRRPTWAALTSRRATAST